MPSLEELSEQCVSVCEVPIDVPRETILNTVEKKIGHGKIVDVDVVNGIETDLNLTRFVLLLTSVEDVKYLCENVNLEDIKSEEKEFTVKFQKSIACELPEEWEKKDIKVQIQDERQSQFSDETLTSAPVPPPHIKPEIPKHLPHTQANWAASGFYQNIPRFPMPGGTQYPGQAPGTTPVSEPGPSQGNMQGQGENTSGAEGHGQSYMPYGQHFPYFGIPPRFAAPGGQRQPAPFPQMMPMYFDPNQYPQFQRFPGIMPPGGKGPEPQQAMPPQQPSGPPPPYNSAEFTQGYQGMQSQAVRDQDEHMRKLQAKIAEGNQQSAGANADYEEPWDKRNEPEMQAPEEKPTKIVVRNLPSTAHEDYLEMFFENTRKFGGGPVESVEYDEENGSAVIEFQQPEAVDVVLGRCPIKMMGVEVEVEVYVPEEPAPLCTIEVTGPCSVVCEDQLETLEMYFENKRKSNGGDVENITFDSDNNMVLVTFQEEEVAQRVVEKATKGHIVMKENLTVKMHVPTKVSKKKAATSESAKDEDQESEPVRTVKVKGVNKEAQRDTIEYYFENAKRSGGGEIENIISDEEEDDILYITFRCEEDAEKVAKRTHKVENRNLTVTLYEPPKPPPSYPNKMLIRGLKPSTSQDCLFNFIEAKTEFIPESMDFHAEQEDVVMVTFESVIDFDILKNVMEKKKLEGASLKVSPVPVSNCIIVANLADEVTMDTVTYYFENERKGGGGTVSKVVMNDDETCLVYFDDYTVIERVLGRKHKLGGQDLDVKLFQDCLGRPEGDVSERKLRVPDPIIIKDVDPQKIKFMAHSKANRDALDTQLKDCHTSIVWPEGKGNILLECTLTTDVKDCFKLVKAWKDNAAQNFNDFMKYIVVNRVSVLKDVWTKVLEEVKTLNIGKPDAVALMLEEKEGFITIVGNTKIANDLTKQIDDITKKATTEAEKEREKTKETVNTLKNIETRMLLADKFPTKMEEKFKDTKVKINQNKNEIVFEGPMGQVRDAMLQMYEMKGSFTFKNGNKLSPIAAGLYGLKQTREYIVKKLKSSRLTSVWDVTDDCLVVCSTSSGDIQYCLEIVQNSVIESTIPLKKTSMSVVNSENWQIKIDELHAYNIGKCHIKVSDDLTKVHICGTDDIASDIVEGVKKFLRLNTVTEVKIPCVQNVHRLIERHHKRELENIAKELVSQHVQVGLQPNFGGFEVRGTEDGVEAAKLKLLNLIHRVKRKPHTVTKPGLAEYMESPKGKDNLNTIETNEPCTISVRSSDESDDSDDNPYESVPSDSRASENIGVQGVTITAHCKMWDCRNVYTVIGDMTALRTEMLVNPADDKLSLSGGLGKAIVKKGGSIIQSECAKYIRDEDRLEDGEVFVSSAGSLNADFVAHVMGPVWRGGMNKEDEMLEEAVFKCLKQASERRLTSVAIPAISCGSYGYPVKKATSTIVDAVKNFFREFQDSSVTDVYLCDVKMSTVDGFNDALKRECASSFQKFKTVEKQTPAQRKSKTKSYDSDSDTDQISPMNTDEEDDIYSGRARGPPPVPTSERPRGDRNSVRIGGISVKIVKGEIAKQQVDAIVNTTAKNLDLKNGAVSLSLLKAAGPELQQEVSSKYPNGVKDGEIAVTSGKNLKCSMVIHSSMANWDGANPAACKKALLKLMTDCMNEADSNGLSSVAFPAIGTGNLGFPRDVVATEMFSAVSKYIESKKSSNIKEVMFIVYQKDFQTIRAFEFELGRWTTGKRGGASGGGRQARKFDPYADLQKGRETKDEGDPVYANISGDGLSTGGGDPGTYRLGCIIVSVKEGDITTEDADCIVNSSNEDLDLSRGAVASQLKRKGGKDLEKEVNHMRKKMKKEHIVITNAPNLSCSKIIHVVAKETAREWEDIVEKCLHLAEKNNLKNIAFPAIGTGLQIKAFDIAEAIIQAIINFEKSQPVHLHEVRLVIFQKEMVTDFQRAVASYSSGTGQKGYRKAPSRTPAGTRQISVDPHTVTFIIYALEDKTIREVIKKLEACIEKEIQVKKYNDSIIMKMDDNQVMEINAIAAQYHLQITVEKDQGRVEVSGLASNVNIATDKIHRIIRDAATIEQQKNAAALMSNLVQWSYLDIGDTKTDVVPYETDLNYKIESAYISKSTEVRFSTNNAQYILDFDKMVEYPADDQTDTVTVLRRDLIKSGGFEPPPTWGDLKGNLRVVVLKQGDKEYTDISQKFLATSGPGFTIVQIERVQNRTLWEQYQAKKKLLEDQNPPNTTNERLLWHGTAVEAVDNINAHGFNRSYCGKNATMFGDGVYFAVNASYSCGNTYSRQDASGVKRVYYCRVLTGEYTQGQRGMRVPPSKPGGASTALYDCVVDKPKGPGMYIIFHDTQAYPEYLVSVKPQ